jgi:molybdenum cofactor cytidylyltransferase
MRVGAVILAAGAATRMGRIKQLLPYRGATLVEHTILTAQKAGFAPVVVVLGAQAVAVGEAVTRTTAERVMNQDWEAGMGSSVTAGVARLLDLDAVAILLADQPCISATDLTAMCRELEGSEAAVVAASYAGTVGVPAIFRNSLIPMLLQLAPDAGARALLRDKGLNVLRYELPAAATDIDTPEDFAALS